MGLAGHKRATSASGSSSVQPVRVAAVCACPSLRASVALTWGVGKAVVRLSARAAGVHQGVVPAGVATLLWHVYGVMIPP